MPVSLNDKKLDRWVHVVQSFVEHIDGERIENRKALIIEAFKIATLMILKLNMIHCGRAVDDLLYRSAASEELLRSIRRSRPDSYKSDKAPTWPPG